MVECEQVKRGNDSSKGGEILLEIQDLGTELLGRIVRDILKLCPEGFKEEGP